MLYKYAIILMQVFLMHKNGCKITQNKAYMQLFAQLF